MCWLLTIGILQATGLTHDCTLTFTVHLKIKDALPQVQKLNHDADCLEYCQAYC